MFRETISWKKFYGSRIYSMEETKMLLIVRGALHKPIVVTGDKLLIYNFDFINK
jgi:hypothetical protein